MKKAIIVDSVAYLPEDLANFPDLYQVDLSVNFNDGSVFNDSSDETRIKEFYQRLNIEKQLPTTSQPPVGDYYALMDKLIEKGYEAIYCIHISSGISGTFQSAVMVTNEYKDKAKIFCIDSKGASVTMEGLVRAAIPLLEQGEDVQEIADKLNWLAENSKIYLMVEDLSNLVKGGRLSATSALLGGMLQIRPLLYFNEEGKIVLFEKIRTNKKVYKRWSELAAEAKQKYSKGIDIAFAHGDVLEEIKNVEAMILKDHPELVSHISSLGPVVGAHTGKGTKGFAIIPHLDNYLA